MQFFHDDARFSGDPTAELRQSGDRFELAINGAFHSVAAVRQGDQILVSFRGTQYRFSLQPPKRGQAAAAGSGDLRATMPGLIVDVRCAVDDVVQRGATLVVLEAMKTQQPLVAPFDGTVTFLCVSAGQQVEEGAVLVKVAANADR